MSRFVVTSHKSTHGDRTYTSHEVRDMAFRRELDGGAVIEGRRVANFTREEEATDYAAWRERVAALAQPGDTE